MHAKGKIFPIIMHACIHVDIIVTQELENINKLIVGMKLKEKNNKEGEMAERGL